MAGFHFVTPDLRRLDEVNSEVIVACLWKDERPFEGLLGLLDWRLCGRLSGLAKTGFIGGDVGEVLLIPTRPRLSFDKMLVCGLGARQHFTDATFRAVLMRALDTLAGLAVKSAVIELPGRGGERFPAERALSILLELVSETEREALCLVDSPEAKERIEALTKHRHRTSITNEG